MDGKPIPVLETATGVGLQCLVSRDFPIRPAAAGKSAGKPGPRLAGISERSWQGLARDDPLRKLVGAGLGSKTGIDRDRTTYRPRDARDDRRPLLPLLLAEEYIAVVKLALRLDDLDCAQAAFATPAVPHHLDAVVGQRVEQRPIATDGHLTIALVVEAHHEFLRCEASSRRESLELESVPTSALFVPDLLRSVAQALRTAQVDLAIGIELVDLRAEVEPPAL